MKGIVLFALSLTGCAVIVPPLRAETGVGYRGGESAGITGVVGVGAHLASAVRETPVEIGGGVLRDQTDGATKGVKAWYVEAGGRVYRSKYQRLWIGARYQRGWQNENRSEGLALRIDYEGVSKQLRAGGGSGGGSSFIGAAAAGVFGSGYYVEVGARRQDERQSYAVVGLTYRFPFMFAAALFK